MRKTLTVLVALATTCLAACQSSPRRQFLAAHAAYQGAAQTAEVLIDHDVVDAGSLLPAARRGRRALKAWGAALAAWESMPETIRPSDPPVAEHRRKACEALRRLKDELEKR